MERFIGNTLDRPQLLLKRNKIRETQFDQESLSSGGNYARQEADRYGGFDIQVQQQQPMMFGSSMSTRGNVAPMKQQIQHSMMSNVAPMAMKSLGGFNNSRSTYLAQDQFKSFLNFLEHSAFVAENLHPDNEGNIEIEIEAEKYSTIRILACDDETCTQSLVCTTELKSEIDKRDLSLTEPLDVDKFYNEVRNSENVKKDDKIVIDDITSTDHIIIDSLDKVKRVQDEIRKVDSIQPVSTDLLFLLKWNKLNEEDKGKKYNKFVCHEVNLFIYFKDKDYFDRVVKPFIANKMEKTFVDLYLLEEYDQILPLSDISEFNNLNAFEQCLLVDVVQKTDKDLAQKLMERIKIEAEATQMSEDKMNKIFDTVLNLNMLQGNQKINLDDLASESDQDTETFTTPQTGFNFGGNLPQYQQQDAFNNQFGNNFGGGLFGGGGMPGNAFGGNNIFAGGFATTQNAFQPQQQQLFGSNQQMTGLFQNFNQMNVQEQLAPMQYQNFDMNQNADNPFGNSYDQMEIRQTQPSQFQALEEACEFCETNYYGNNSLASTHIFKHHKFWSDLAEHIVKTGSIEGFQTSSFVFAYNKLTEMLCSWAVLDLDFESKKHIIRSSGSKGISIKAAGNLIVFKKEIKEAQSELDTNILVIHRFFENGKKGSDEKTKEYLTHQIYGCEVIITNVSSKSQTFQILWQIPSGSLPVYNTNYQKSEHKSLSAYSTTRFEFYFYFPYEGSFKQFPSNITIEDKVVAVANKCTFEVGIERQQDSFETFKDILISGDEERILEFLATKNLRKGEKGFNFNDMYWMYEDKEFWIKVVDVLRDRRIYDDTTWKYSFKHYDHSVIMETVKSTQHVIDSIAIFAGVGKPKQTRHLDYFPLINARAHTVGKNINAGLLNVQFRATYYGFLKSMIEKEELDNSDWLNFAYYLLLQDRIKECMEIINGKGTETSIVTGTSKSSPKINSDNIKVGGSLKLQYDYMCAYLDFFTGIDTGFKIARSIAKQYEEYPVIAWRILFTEILDQLKEFDGEQEEDLGPIDQEDEEKKKQNLKISKKMETYLECEIEGKQITVEYANIPTIKVKYYVIDLEVLFSRAPFLIQCTDDLANAKPIKIEEYKLDDNMKSTKFDISAEFLDQNVMIEVHGQSKQKFLTYFSNAIKVHITEEYGELKVTTKDDKPLPKVYIKAIAQYGDSDTKFFKDGYTDIRGKFEYAQINSKKMSGIKKFALLIMSDNYGALTKEAKPPRNIDQSEIVKKDVDMAFLKPQQYARWNARKCK